MRANLFREWLAADAGVTSIEYGLIGVLRTATGAAQANLLAFHLARVAGDEAGLAHQPAPGSGQVPEIAEFELRRARHVDEPAPAPGHVEPVDEAPVPLVGRERPARAAPRSRSATSSRPTMSRTEFSSPGLQMRVVARPAATPADRHISTARSLSA